MFSDFRLLYVSLTNDNDICVLFAKNFYFKSDIRRNRTVLITFLISLDNQMFYSHQQSCIESSKNVIFFSMSLLCYPVNNILGSYNTGEMHSIFFQTHCCSWPPRSTFSTRTLEEQLVKLVPNLSRDVFHYKSTSSIQRCAPIFHSTKYNPKYFFKIDAEST